MNNCYKLIKITEKITIPPKFFTNYEDYIINQLKQKENKCTKYGFIKKIDKLIYKSDGLFYDVDFSGDLLFNIIYTAYVCNPDIGIEINCKIVQIILEDDFIAAEINPLFINVIMSHDKKKDLEILQPGDEITVLIVAKRLNLNDNKIKIVAQYVKQVKDI